jgi:bifunctional DNase/RNase
MNTLTARIYVRAVAVAALAGSLGIPHAVTAAEPTSQVRVETVEVAVTPMGPVVLLKVRDKAIPIFVDVVVAESIQGALSGRKALRPLTHDLMHSVLQGFNGRVSQVVVTLKERIFHAALTIDMGAARNVFDSRSSDAIALAVHFKAPILVSEQLVEEVGVELRKPGEVRS